MSNDSNKRLRENVVSSATFGSIDQGVAAPLVSQPPFSYLVQATSLEQLHHLTFGASSLLSFNSLAPHWLYILSCGQHRIASPTTKYYCPPSGWEVVTTNAQDGSILTIGRENFIVEPSAWCFISSLASQGRTYRLTIGMESVYLSRWRATNEGGATLTSVFRVDPTLSEEKVQFCVATLGFIDRFRNAAGVGSAATSIAAMAWIIVRGMGRPSLGDTIAMLVECQTTAAATTRALELLSIEEGGTSLAGFLGAVSSVASSSLSHQERWESFSQIRKYVTHRPALAQIADSLRLHLPISPETVKDFYIGSREWLPVRLDTLQDTAMLPLGNKAASGQQVIAFISQVTPSVLVVESVDTVLLKKRTDSKSSEPRFESLGNCDRRGLPIIGVGPIKALFTVVVTKITSVATTSVSNAGLSFQP